MKKNNYYWKPEHQEQIKLYYEAQLVADCDAIRNRIFSTTLYPVFVIMQETALKLYGVKRIEEDYIQDIAIHLFTKTLPRLKEDKLEGQLNFLWTSVRNYVITYILKAKDILVLDESEQFKVVDDVDIDESYNKSEQRARIISELDKMIRGQKIINSQNSVFLILLKSYIIENDFDVRGFGAYVMLKMKLTLSQYRSIAARLGIRTKFLNEGLVM